MMRLLIAVLYTQYSLKQQNGKAVTPWSNTCFYLALVGTFIVVGALKGLLDYTHHMISMSPYIGLECLLFIGGIMSSLFFAIKQLYFNTGKYIEYCRWFEEKDARTQSYISNIVNVALFVIPVVLLSLADVGTHHTHKFWH